MSELIHAFAGNPMNRGEVERRSDEWLAAALQHADARWLPMWRLNPLVQSGPTEQLHLGWCAQAELPPLPAAPPAVFLGTLADVPHFAIDVSELADAAGLVSDDRRIEEARSAAGQLSVAEAGVLAQARAQIGWHQRNGFCSICGATTKQRRGGQVRTCTGCGADNFPRTDPVAIMLITDGDRCLLGQSQGRLRDSNMYSALAGFIDQGESIEEAVRREVQEEAGISVGAVRYHSSQPWPFPSSLMIGCHGDAATTEINFDPDEMTDVRWFDRAGVIAALAGTNPELRVPGALAIAHHLIRSWATGEV